MDHSTEGVTLYTVFLLDVLQNYEESREDYKELFDLIDGVDLSDPKAKVPITLYNDMCQWIEDNLGKFNLIQVGRKVGETAFAGMLEQGVIEEPVVSPMEVLEGLVKVASEMIQDPKGRGWEILESGTHYAVLRRTQTFNSKLQLGLLSGLVRKAKVNGVNVQYLHAIEDGDLFDDYRVTWA